MNGSTPETAEPTYPRFSVRLADFRLIPRIDTYPKVVTFAQSAAGKCVLLVLFGAGLACAGLDWLPLSLMLTLMTFLPDHRRLLLVGATLNFTFLASRHSVRDAALTFCVLLLGALLFQCATRWPQSWFGRRPVFLLLTGFAILLLCASLTSRSQSYYSSLWHFAYFLSTYIWFIAYSLSDAKSSGHDSAILQVGTYRPFWGSTNTPYAKGSAYLRRIEARDSRQLAVTQLKGLKLLAWALLINLFGKYFFQFAYGYLGVATFERAMFLSAHRNVLPWYTCWAALLASFFGGIIQLAGTGHQIVACCRMAGFQALRNTYRPLSSRTVAEFFNRYYFYFKELLVDFFFYPTFFRFFKRHRKLRLIVSIFAAACFGNAFYHFTRDLGFIQTLGLAQALAGYQVYLFYSVVLATAISISQLRPRAPRPEGFLFGQLLPSLSVVLFYCLLDVFGSTQRNYPLTEHFRFFAHLFNLEF